MNDILFDRLHQGLGTVLTLRQKQHSLTAANMANVDTPNYKAKIIRFDEVLSEAVDDQDFAMKKTNGMHFSSLSGGAHSPDIEEVEAPPWAMDKNSVNLERELVRLKENSLMFKSVTKGLGKRLGMLRFSAGNGK